MSKAKAPTTDEWIAELERIAQSVGAEGMTVNEIAEQVPCHRDTASKWIKRAVKAGAWEYAGRQYRTAMDAVRRPVPVYRPKK